MIITPRQIVLSEHAQPTWWSSLPAKLCCLNMHSQLDDHHSPPDCAVWTCTANLMIITPRQIVLSEHAQPTWWSSLPARLCCLNMHSQLDDHHSPSDGAVCSVSYHQIVIFRTLLKYLFRAPTKLPMVSGVGVIYSALFKGIIMVQLQFTTWKTCTVHLYMYIVQIVESKGNITCTRKLWWPWSIWSVSFSVCRFTELACRARSSRRRHVTYLFSLVGPTWSNSFIQITRTYYTTIIACHRRAVHDYGEYGQSNIILICNTIRLSKFHINKNYQRRLSSMWVSSN